MSESLKIKTTFRAPAKEVYEAWMDSAKHSLMTGGTAEIDPKIGGKFTAWDGYISGETVELDPYTRIVQLWRTGDFNESDPYSRIEILLDEKDGETGFVLIHENIPAGQKEDYLEGWSDYYLDPMHDYFSNRSG